MKVSEHNISKVCKKEKKDRYMQLTNTPDGLLRLICYAVDFLIKKKIETSYPNICVAVWKMFPDTKRFQLEPFTDFPDTNEMERFIKSHAMPKYKNVMRGGSSKSGNERMPYQLTDKGKQWAEEAALILSGKKRASAKITVSKSKKTAGAYRQTDYNKIFKSVVTSNLFKLYEEELEGGTKNVMSDYKITKLEAVNFLGLPYPMSNLKKVGEAQLAHLVESVKRSRDDKADFEKQDSIESFLNWVEKKGVNYD